MTNIIRKENGREPASFGNVVDQIFQSNLSRFFEDDNQPFNGLLGRNQVPVNIRETDKSYEMEFIAPGLKKQDFQLNLSGDTLTVSFEQKQENKQADRNEGWLRQEYRKHAFMRTFTLDETTDVSKIAAKYEDGVLHLVIPKKEHAQKLARSIQVQ